VGIFQIRLHFRWVNSKLRPFDRDNFSSFQEKYSHCWFLSVLFGSLYWQYSHFSYSLGYQFIRFYFMAQPTSGDDYYAKIWPTTPQAGVGTEKKKIKIVAKKAAAPQAEKVEPVVVPTPEPAYDTNQAVLQPEEPPVYVPRVVKLPESGSLDLGTKFTSRPAVVFHNRPAPSRPAPSPSSHRPPQGGIAGSRPNFVSRSPQGSQGGGFGQRRPGTSSPAGWSRPGTPQSSSNKSNNFRKPDAPKKNFKTTKRGTKHKLTFIADEKEDLDTFRRAKGLVGEKQEKNIDNIKQTLVDRSGQEVEIGDFLTVKEFSDKIGISLARIIGELMKNGIVVNINSQIDFDTCFLIAEGFDITSQENRTFHWFKYDRSHRWKYRRTPGDWWCGWNGRASAYHLCHGSCRSW
jgi:ribosomal protein S25